MILRLTAPIVALSLLLLAVGAIAAWYLHRIQKDVTAHLAQDVAGGRAAEELVIDAIQIEIHLDQFLLTGDPAHLDAAASLRGQTMKWLEAAESLAEAGRERDLLSGLRTAHHRFWSDLAAIRRRPDVEAMKPGIRDLSSRILTDQLRIPAQAYLDAKEEEVERSSARNQTMPARIGFGLLLLGVCGAAAGLLAGFGIARGISRSIAQLSVPIHDAAGKLSEVVGPLTLSPTWDVAGLEGMLHRVSEEVGTVIHRLEQSRREVLRSEQLAALGQLAAGLAHELRNPLTSMKILVQSTADRGEPAGLTGRSLAILEEEIIRLERSIQSFLDFARPAEVERRPFDLTQVLDQILGLVSPRAALQSVAIETELPDGPLVIEADASHLRQMLLNLLLNALDAVPQGGTITVRVAYDPPDHLPAGPEADGRRLTIQVADTGHGLPPEIHVRLFEPFFSTKETGLGLGLPICKRIVEAHGGHITATDRPEGGALFTARLPLGGADRLPPAAESGTVGR
jgi:signal transduction histidine kinase